MDCWPTAGRPPADKTGEFRSIVSEFVVRSGLNKIPPTDTKQFMLARNITYFANKNAAQILQFLSNLFSCNIYYFLAMNVANLGPRRRALLSAALIVMNHSRSRSALIRNYLLRRMMRL